MLEYELDAWQAAQEACAIDEQIKAAVAMSVGTATTEEGLKTGMKILQDSKIMALGFDPTDRAKEEKSGDAFWARQRTQQDANSADSHKASP